MAGVDEDHVILGTRTEVGHFNCIACGQQVLVESLESNLKAWNFPVT